jgi:replication factor A1
MAIKDLQARQPAQRIEAVVVDMGPVREFNKFGKTGKVATARIKDATGECNLSLWNEQVDLLKKGDHIIVTDGYVTEWQGEVQLTTGRMGKLEVVESGARVLDDKPEEPKAEESDTVDDGVEEETIDED